MLLCDNCDDGWHMYCLPAPLSTVPDGDWFCEECSFDVGDSDLVDLGDADGDGS